jgi:hypothetical protein
MIDLLEGWGFRNFHRAARRRFEFTGDEYAKIIIARPNGFKIWRV